MSAPASASPSWLPLEGTVDQILFREQRPFQALADGRVPAAIVRGAYPLDQCAEIVRRLYDVAGIEERRGMAYDAVGTSLVNRGANPEAFFAHARETHALFGHLFEGLVSPVDRLYALLAALAPGRDVKVAREPDGRLYGPAIFRLYPAGKGHDPHFDSLPLKERWTHYAAGRFRHQFAGVLCLQDTGDPHSAGESIIHRQFWFPELQPTLDALEFHAWAEEHGTENATVHLKAGDFYVFNPFHIHEVPYITGERPRIVLATFIGYSPDDDEVFVWA